MSKRNNSDNEDKIKPISLPKKLDNPFFAYGIFKKDQIAYSKIEEYVKGNPIEACIPRQMLMRDGIPLIKDKDDEHFKTKGDLIYDNISILDLKDLDILGLTISFTLKRLWKKAKKLMDLKILPKSKISLEAIALRQLPQESRK